MEIILNPVGSWSSRAAHYLYRWPGTLWAFTTSAEVHWGGKKTIKLLLLLLLLFFPPLQRHFQQKHLKCSGTFKIPFSFSTRFHYSCDFDLFNKFKIPPDTVVMYFIFCLDYAQNPIKSLQNTGRPRCVCLRCEPSKAHLSLSLFEILSLNYKLCRAYFWLF